MSGSADGDFGAKTREAVMLFQKQAGLTVDGKAGSATVSKLFSSSAENYDGKTTVSTSGSSDSSSGSSSQSSSGVIMADWWTSNIQSVFSRGTIATVTDVDTGISWKVKRRGGTKPCGRGTADGSRYRQDEAGIRRQLVVEPACNLGHGRRQDLCGVDERHAARHAVDN